MSADQTISLPDGRTLGFATFGDPAGVPVLALHGTPGSRLKFADSGTAARKLGLRIIAVDRWGYGLSSPKPDAALSDFGADMVMLAGALQLETCLVLGVSGGGPFAVASAVALGRNLKALALVSPVGPVDARTPLSLLHQICFRVLPPLKLAIPAAFQIYRAGLLAAPELAVRLAFALAPAADRSTLDNPHARRGLAEAFAAGLSPGIAGAVTDMTLFSRPWGLEPSRIGVPAKIWIGTADRNVPQAAVLTLAEAIPRAQIEHLPGEGHLWIAEHGEAVLKWLANPA